MAETVTSREIKDHFGRFLRLAAEKKSRFVITRSGRPSAVLLGFEDFEDIVEELDPEFQKSLRAAAAEHRVGRAIPLEDYVKRRGSPSRRVS